MISSNDEIEQKIINNNTYILYKIESKLNELNYEYDYKYRLLEKKVYNLLIIFVIITFYNLFNDILQNNLTEYRYLT